MVRLTPPPAGVQDRQVYDYLYQLQEYLRQVLDGAEEPGGTAAAAGRAAERAVSKEIGSQVEQLKALIIKTAEVVESHTAVDLSGLRRLIEELGDVVEGDGGLRVQLLSIQNEYAALSGQFGEYRRAIAQTLSATAEGLEQRIALVESLASLTDTDFRDWLVRSAGYINSGVVGYRSDSTPIIGIAIGQELSVLTDASGDEVTVTVDGVNYRVIRQEGFRAVYAADELSFWQDDVKVAYMSNNRLYITDVQALGTLTVGQWRISGELASRGLTVKWVG